MSEKFVREGVAGDDPIQEDTIAKIGKAAAKLDELAEAMSDAKDTDTARFDTLRKEQRDQAAVLTALKSEHDAAVKAALDKAESDETKELIRWAHDAQRAPSKAGAIGQGPAITPSMSGYEKGAFLYAVHEANARDAERQSVGKRMFAELAASLATSKGAMLYEDEDGKPTLREESWGKATAWSPGYGKSTLGDTDAAGGWIIPNAIVDEFIKPASIENIYRTLMTSVSGVTAFAVDIPFRSAIRTRAAIAAFGATKDNRNLAYNGYTATMYTIAAIYDIGNQFLRQSRGAAEQDVMGELSAAFAQGEAFYIREGTGSSQPFGYTSALTNGPSSFRTTFTPSATTLAGSIATSIALAGGALAGRGVGARGGQGLSAVLSASVYWQMLSQGTDTAGFFFNPAGGPTGINAPPGVLVSPFGIPVYPDADADIEGTAAVIDNLIVADWKRFKVYYGQTYRVDSSDQAGTRWDTNLTGFRGEEEMGFDARPVVYAGHAQMITDVTP